MDNKKVPIEVYKKLICEMIDEMNDDWFIRQIYSIIYRHKERTGS